MVKNYPSKLNKILRNELFVFKYYWVRKNQNILDFLSMHFPIFSYRAFIPKGINTVYKWQRPLSIFDRYIKTAFKWVIII